MLGPRLLAGFIEAPVAAPPAKTSKARVNPMARGARTLVEVSTAVRRITVTRIAVSIISVMKPSDHEKS